MKRARDASPPPQWCGELPIDVWAEVASHVPQQALQTLQCLLAVSRGVAAAVESHCRALLRRAGHYCAIASALCTLPVGKQWRERRTRLLPVPCDERQMTLALASLQLGFDPQWEALRRLWYHVFVAGAQTCDALYNYLAHPGTPLSDALSLLRLAQLEQEAHTVAWSAQPAPYQVLAQPWTQHEMPLSDVLYYDAAQRECMMLCRAPSLWVVARSGSSQNWLTLLQAARDWLRDAGRHVEMMLLQQLSVTGQRQRWYGGVLRVLNQQPGLLRVYEPRTSDAVHDCCVRDAQGHYHSVLSAEAEAFRERCFVWPRGQTLEQCVAQYELQWLRQRNHARIAQRFLTATTT